WSLRSGSPHGIRGPSERSGGGRCDGFRADHLRSARSLARRHQACAGRGRLPGARLHARQLSSTAQSPHVKHGPLVRVLLTSVAAAIATERVSAQTLEDPSEALLHVGAVYTGEVFAGLA